MRPFSYAEVQCKSEFSTGLTTLNIRLRSPLVLSYKLSESTNKVSGVVVLMFRAAFDQGV